jgi:hypothetical protein
MKPVAINKEESKISGIIPKALLKSEGTKSV